MFKTPESEKQYNSQYAAGNYSTKGGKTLMQDLKSRVAYLQGLSAGLDIHSESKEGRLLSGIIEVLNDFAKTVNSLEKAHDRLEDYLETIDEDLYQLEDHIYDEDLAEKEYIGAEDYMEVECPGCGETVCFEADVLEDDDTVEITCPNCDEVVYISDERLEAADEPELLEIAKKNYEDDI
jgi:ribosomal protein S27E